MLPKHQPATSIDKIVDLAAFSDFMALKSNDVAFLVARALRQHLADIDLRLQFTGRHASILFPLSLNTSPLQEAWRVVAQATAPFYAAYLLIDSAEERGLVARTVPTFDWQDTLDTNRTFATYITRMATALLAQDTPPQSNRLDLLTQEEILVQPEGP
jgi:hypothetical protein